MKPQVHVVGAGGIGIALAWSLAHAGWDVTLVERNPAKLAAGRADGLGVAGRLSVKLPFVAFTDWRPPADAIILLCTKTYDNPAVLARLATLRHLVPVQNGYDAPLDSHDFAAEGIASFVSECDRERPFTRITRPGRLHLGARRPATAEERDELRALAEGLRQSVLFEVELVEDVRPFKAAKLMYNAAISPLAAAAGVDNAALLTDSLAKRLFFGLLLENHAILRRAGLALAKIGPFHPDTVVRILRTPGLPTLMANFFRPSLRGTYCSMAPDVGHGETEIEAYNGHLVRLAGNFPCPLNRAAVRMIERITQERSPPRRSHLDDMVADLAGRGSPA
ncbi:ketopantoate reductase family protein [Hypericibacter sp.]|uniref:ketopantoate reductase family protein n=1 Tax=Hypericibacter sp. TaxID=2705401 RepID=UPI003D6D848F